MAFQRVQRELSADEIERLRALRAAGKQIKWLAIEFGISHQTASRYARGITPPSPPPTASVTKHIRVIWATPDDEGGQPHTA